MTTKSSDKVLALTHDYVCPAHGTIAATPAGDDAAAVPTVLACGRVYDNGDGTGGVCGLDAPRVTRVGSDATPAEPTGGLAPTDVAPTVDNS